MAGDKKTLMYTIQVQCLACVCLRVWDMCVSVCLCVCVCVCVCVCAKAIYIERDVEKGRNANNFLYTYHAYCW